MAKSSTTKIRRNCQFCKNDFFAKSKPQKLCSVTCAALNASAKHKAISQSRSYMERCKQCSKDFRVQMATARKMDRRSQSRPKYCSKKCNIEFIRSQPAPEYETCTQCGNTHPFNLKFFTVSGQPSLFGLTRRCKECTNKKSNRDNIRRQRELRIEILTAYGNGRLACVCCNESNQEFLCLDHIYGGGSAERKRIKTRSLWYELRRQGFPKGKHRTLCHNCNQSYGLYGYCPHQKGSHSP